MALPINDVFLRNDDFARPGRCGNTILRRGAGATYLRISAVAEPRSDWGGRCSAPKSRKYNEDEMQYVWLQRIGLGLGWNEVHENFDRQFPARMHLELHDTRRLQSKFYRMCKQKGRLGPK